MYKNIMPIYDWIAEQQDKQSDCWRETGLRW